MVSINGVDLKSKKALQNVRRKVNAFTTFFQRIDEVFLTFSNGFQL